MGTTAGTTGTNVASLQNQLAAAVAAANSLTGGGGTAAATTPGAATTPAANAAAPAAAGAAGGTNLTARIPATGKYETREIGGRTRYFDDGIDPNTNQRRADGNAYEITAFQYTEAHSFKIKLDYREGIATGLANLSRIFGARQERVRLLSNALANDANSTGAFNPVDLQKMSLETTTTQQLSEMQKKIFDSMRDSIQAWLR
jgi:hypothetical protein